MVNRNDVACLIFALSVAASFAAAQRFDCRSGSIVVPPGDYGAIIIDIGATACGSVTIADVAADSIVIFSSGGSINVTGAIAITRLTCKPAASICVEFASAVVAADSITLRGATYNSSIVASGSVDAMLLRFQGAVSDVRLIVFEDVDMRVSATSTGADASCFSALFSFSVTEVGALEWRNTTMIASLTAASYVQVASWRLRALLPHAFLVDSHRHARAGVAQHVARRVASQHQSVPLPPRGSVAR
jgi:hypothetical protein